MALVYPATSLVVPLVTCTTYAQTSHQSARIHYHRRAVATYLGQIRRVCVRDSRLHDLGDRQQPE